MTDRTPPTSSSRPSPPPPVVDYATLDVATDGLDPDQEIRARALELAIDAIARIPSHADYRPLAHAGQYAEWIRSGWPRMDGNDGCPHHQPADTEEPAA